MIYYYSSPSPYKEVLLNLGLKSFLLSYAVDAKKGWVKFINDEIPLIIDSGAFSAWNKGHTIDIKAYLAFCKTLPESCIFVNLDVIPQTGSHSSEVEKCCQQGFENFKFLKEHLKNVLPVYHYKDHIDWAHRYLEHVDYLGISPANDTVEEVKMAYLDYFFSHVPLTTRTHAFGYTSAFGMRKYPFYSVDSTTWMCSARFARVIDYARHRKELSIVHMEPYLRSIGIPYDMNNKIPRAWTLKAIEYSVKNLMAFMEDVTLEHKTKDFSYLKSQTTLF